MKGYSFQLAVLVAIAFFIAKPDALAQTDTDWIGTVGNFNDGANWDEGFPPAAFAGEFGEINNGGTAFVIDQPNVSNPGPGGLTLGEDAGEFGGLEIRTGGRLEILTDELAMVVGNLVVGLNGEGQMTVFRGGEIEAVNLSSGGNVASTITLGETGGSGTASVVITGASNLDRTTRVIGPNVDFTSGSLAFGDEHVLIPEITGPMHSALKASSASLGGSVDVVFNGVTPALGDSWDLVDAATISGSFSSVSTSSTLPAGLGVFVSSQAGGTNGNVAQLSVGVHLALTVDRRTGAAAIQNRSAGGTVDVDAYAILSDDAALDPAGWNSFTASGQADWFEANANERHLTELNLDGARAIGPESTIDLGTPYTFTPTALGEANPEVTFDYTNANGTFAGLVEFTGPHNNVVLIVNPDSGAAAIQNQSIFDVSLDGYAILSDSASLDPAGWVSLEDSGQADWFEANPTDGHLTEVNLGGDTMLTGGSSPLAIGSPFSTSATAQRDLMFEFTLSSGETMAGVVEYGEIPDIMPPGGIPGDYNNNGQVEQGDLDLVLLNWGQPGVPGGWTNDLPMGNIDQAELDGVLLNWGNAAAAGLGTAAGVPEPASWLLAIGAMLSLFANRVMRVHVW